MQVYAIIVAGGGGKRFGTAQPKQFQLLAGKPLLMYSVEAFFETIEHIRLIVVLPDDFIPLWKKLCTDFHFTIPHSVIGGGPERFHSVKRGLTLVDGDGLVAIHDGARPLVAHSTISEVFRMARIARAVAPAVVPADTVRQVAGAKSKPLVRETLRLMQTPQVFDISLIKKAYLQSYDASFTDDAVVIESIGVSVSLVDGDVENIKITRPVDLLFAEAILKARINKQEIHDQSR